MTPTAHKWETVYIAFGQPEAEVIRGRLTAEEIPSLLAYESVGQTWGFTVGLGQVEVKVPRELAELAKTIIGDV